MERDILAVMRWAALLMLCGCNQIFGVDSTRLFDAAPPIDAPAAPVCPEIGTAPTFRGELRQLPTKGCMAYAPSPSAGRALASCYDATRGSTIQVGAIDGELAAVLLSPDPGFGIWPRFAPEGDRFLAGQVTYSTTETPPEYALLEFQVNAEGTWTQLAPTTTNPINDLSTPSAGPDRRLLMAEYDTNYAPWLVEYSDVSGAWMEIARSSYADIGVTAMMELSLSADARRLVFVEFKDIALPVPGVGEAGTKTGVGGVGGGPTGSSMSGAGFSVFYMDRLDTSKPFGKAQELTTVPSGVEWPYLSDDCSRIYFSGLDTVFYLKQ